MKIGVGVLHLQFGYVEMWQHLAALMHATAKAGHRVIQMCSEGSVPGRMRCEIAQAAMDQGCDAVCFIDHDQIFAPDSLNRLIAWDVPVVGGLYPTRHPPYRSTSLAHGDNGYRELTVAEIQSGGLVPVAVVSMGFSLIRREVFAQIPAPWFQQTHVDECANFCQKCEAAGIPLAVDTGLTIGHLAVVSAQFGPEGTPVFCAPSMQQERVAMPEKVGV